MVKLAQLKLIGQKRGGLIIGLAIGLYVLLFSFFSVWKYVNFAYNAMDLAIINQVFYQSGLGDWFSSSLHSPTYLGDHFSPILFFLLPIYLLAKSPLTLLVLQTVVLALSAWPVYLISKRILGQTWALVIGLVWLANPFVQNINLFEFSFLPFAIFLILWAFYFYQNQKFWPFLAFVSLALLVREDVSLVVMMFGLLALVGRRKIKWWLTPLILGLVYFGLSVKIVDFFVAGGQYKFFVYYSWLGNSPVEFIKNAIWHPGLVAFHLVSNRTLEFVLGALLPFAFLPLVRPKHLLLAGGIFAQLALGSAGLSATLLQMHYFALFLPALFISLIYSLDYIINHGDATKDRLVKLIRKEKGLAKMILAVTIIYAGLTLGPLVGSISQLATAGLIWPPTPAKAELIKKIPPQAAVAATYDFLANLSSRPNLYSFNYVFLGKTQFLVQDYVLPADTQYLLIDYQNLISYQLQYQQNPFYQLAYQTALANWSKALDGFGLVALDDTLALYQKGAANQFDLVQVLNQPLIVDFKADIVLADQIKFLGYNQPAENHYQFFWQAIKIPTANYRLQVTLWQDGKMAEQKIYPLAYDLLPVNQWPVGQAIQTDYWFQFDKKLPAGNYELKINLVEVTKGGLDVNSLRSSVNTIDKFIPLAEPWAVGSVTL